MDKREFEQKIPEHHVGAAHEVSGDKFITVAATFQGVTHTFGIPYVKDELPDSIQKLAFGALDIAANAGQGVRLELSSNSEFGERLILLLRGNTLSYANQICKMLLDLPADRQDEINDDLAYCEITTSHELFDAITTAPLPPNRILEDIARKHMHVETLETRHSDSLDFSEVSVWSLKAALEEAFVAGAEHQLSLASDRESPTGHDSVEKPSVLAKLREASTAHPVKSRIIEPDRKKSGPEL